jgi:hypothetical protein
VTPSLRISNLRYIGTKAVFERSKKPSNDAKGKRIKSPSNGHIGRTRFDILVPIFHKSLGSIFSREDLSNFISLTAKSHDKYITHHGIVEGTSKWKSIIDYANGLLEGKEPENPGWVSTGRADRWPKALTHLRPLYHFVIDNCHDEEKRRLVSETRRLLNTLFKLNRVCSANSTLASLKDLKKRVKLDPLFLRDFELYARSRLGEVREGITPSDLSFELFIGPSNGAIGKPKLISA